MTTLPVRAGVHDAELAWHKAKEALAWTERTHNRIPREVRWGDRWWCGGPFCHPGLVCASGAMWTPASALTFSVTGLSV